MSVTTRQRVSVAVASAILVAAAVVTAVIVHNHQYYWSPAPVESWSAVTGSNTTLVVHHMADGGTVRVDVVETETSVQLTAWVRLRSGRVYIAMGVPGTAKITLKAPVGDRVVLNAAGDPLPRADP